jgi:4-amino-4-deoxy-L-arabinose transferase-like glycosyltransferase
MPVAPPSRPRSTLLTILLLWLAFYASFTLFTPPLLDDADSVHAEVAREMLLRHDYLTLHANSIRYLEKAPLLYWSMAATMRAFQLCGATSAQALAVAARIPLSLTILALALLVEAFARRLFHTPEHPNSGSRAGLYAALILLSSFGIFLFTRITIPDAMVCLFTTAALYAFYRTEEATTQVPQATTQVPQATTQVPQSTTQAPRGFSLGSHSPEKKGLQPPRYASSPRRLYCTTFAASCALNVLTKGLIGLVFPAAIIVLYLLLTRSLRNTAHRLRELHPKTTLATFLLIATPWHILAGLANPTQGHPTPFHFVAGHWQVPLPTDGNVHGWFWFYFMNEHLLRYLNLRIPHDYDTSPLWLFWGLCLVWLMPWSAFLFKATAWAAPFFGKSHHTKTFRTQLRQHTLPLKHRGKLLLLTWAAVILLFFALSTRQEYYVLPALPALAILIAGWLAQDTLTPIPLTESSSPLAAEAPSRPATESSSRPKAAHYAAEAKRPLYSPSSEEPTESGAPHLASEMWVSDNPTTRAAQRITAILLTLGTLFAAASLYFLLHTRPPAPHTDLATLLQQNPSDYALSMGHFLDLNASALGLFRIPLALAALSLFLGPLAAFLLRKRAQPHAANLALATGAFGFLLAAHLGLQTFAPVLTSAQLAKAIAQQVHPQDLIILHGEYESGSTLGFYLQRADIHILEGRSSNLWYGSFFPDAPKIFETPQSIAKKWASPQRIFLWQSLTDPPNTLPPLPPPVYILIKSNGKEILSNQPNR